MKGVLLYPLCINNINREYKLENKLFAVNTLDLSKDFKTIEKQLLNILHYFDI